ncbi:MAG: hypothetical protein COX02_01170 [Candidatus Vogelbacteria bacterium CG22_combo_CG10-13_8_21_14_all_37_9]|uniref:Type II secretion system protein GspF domain-containing protein n=1 Tax=Candidatus Vogelbacteria bacterium CG22_combo_CG10-13_8_21_14_all_37_9 TaxID=1975046 RepID=A0A2H0BKW5_9BACT|nr:MAG: hypothetical protein BK005_00665 [bacterium CG10_37_50]PIP58271.1 MAG: hypothetical protein COX02_01170 [Candidatus Vogelbacteria bacterium CG22_combo_CG10-13_8_21_14_all_37_9]
MKFQFKAKNLTGQELDGNREAIDRLSLARSLRAEGWTLIVAEEIKSELTKTKYLTKLFAQTKQGRISLKEKILFVNNLGAMIEAGLPLVRALTVIDRQTKNKRVKIVVKAIVEKVDHGSSLSLALASFPTVFPEIFIAMIGVAEESGRLPETLKLLGEQLSKSYDLRRKIIGAMIYPAIIILAIGTVGVLMLIFLIPTLAITFRELNVPLPLSTRFVIASSDFISNNLILCFVFVLALISGFYYASRTVLGHKLINRSVLFLPVVGTLSRQFNSAAIMRTLSSLISSGVSMVESLRITRKTVNNNYYQTFLAKAMTQVQQGLPLGSVFEDRPDLFPTLAIEMAQVGEETGKLPEMLLRGALFFEAEVDQATKNLSTIIEPVLMIVIGIAVGFFAVSMLGPMYSLSGAIN